MNDFDTGKSFSWHRLLCHSLVRSEHLSSMVNSEWSIKIALYSPLSIHHSTVQECDATKMTQEQKVGYIKISVKEFL